MKIKLQNFIDGLIPYDYILFGSVIALFVLFIILAVLLRRKLTLAIFFVLLAFAVFLLGPTLGYMQMHKFLFKNHTELVSQKKLNFSQAVVVKGTITNDSKFDFKSCKITANVYKVTANKYKNYIYRLKPFAKMSIVEEDIKKGQTKEFKIIVEPFTYKRDYNISLGANCK
ncbi:DUF2393 domain-containing protein [Sulfurimonas paralvinellae]|uniref:DUF2393 domain-containing protein n=1 Tax=Sulfurimonas paralvinellae TaxID=317658 RepID=A0A7M1B9T3_9BACT|nr:DUF2393 domain-containing protein [Sulfurimonas paralvinellae]QOP46391.1 DUF2393 domain-containing protein [Sulfurimonas paralvinellae]